MNTIIFDFDGVIHNTFDLAFEINRKLLGSTMTPSDFKDQFDGNLFKSQLITNDEAADFFKYQHEEFKKLKLSPEVKSHLENLSKEYALYIVTSNKEETLNMYFENNKSANLFTDILGFETDKSKVNKFNMLFEKYNFNASECVFVTDTLGDILEANKVGVKSIAVDFGYHERERLVKGNPSSIVSNYAELIQKITSK